MNTSISKYLGFTDREVKRIFEEEIIGSDEKELKVKKQEPRIMIISK